MPRYVAHVLPFFETARATWSALAEDGAALPFQSPTWLAAWAATKGRDPAVEPLAVTVRDRDGAAVLALPLVREKRGLTRILFADSGMADYNAPIISRDAPQTASGAQSLWNALLRALPPCDQIRFERMPERVGDLINPLTLVENVRPSPAAALAFDMPETYDAWFRGKSRRYRMELGRCARLFDNLPDARFERVRGNGMAAMQALESLQRNRIATLGRPYLLDGERERDFYRAIAQNMHGEEAILTTLSADREIIAALFGMRRRSYFVMLRIGASEALSHVSPARQAIVRTMEMLRADGVTRFDFGLGDYPYKRKLGGESVALSDLIVGRSLTGFVDTARLRVRAHLRANPTIHAAVRRVAEIARSSRQSR